MVVEPGNQHAAEDAEVIRLAKSRLIRVCRLNGPAAEQAMSQAAREQHSALVAVALRVLAAIPADLAAGKVVPLGRPGRPTESRRPPHQRPHSKPSHRNERRGRRR